MRIRLSPSLVVSVLALFVALGGVATAAVDLPWNSVGNEQLKWSAVDSSKVANRSLKAIDFAQGQLPRGEQGDRGAKGAKGEKGEAGARGPAGAAASGAAVGQTVTDANGVVAGTLVSLYAYGGTWNLRYFVRLSNGLIADYQLKQNEETQEYETFQADGDRLQLFSLDGACSAWYVVDRYRGDWSAYPRGMVFRRYGTDLWYTISQNAIPVDPSTMLYYTSDSPCEPDRTAAEWNATEAQRLVEVDAPPVLKAPLTIG